MRQTLTMDDATAAVWGGAILGGGGGGHTDNALHMLPKIFEKSPPQLWTPDEFDNEALTATVSLVGMPSVANTTVSPKNAIRSLELLKANLDKHENLQTVNANENGAETTINALIYAAGTHIPIIDLACNGRAHPTSLMGSMGLHLEKNYISTQGFAGGAGEAHVEGFLSGALESTSNIIRSISTVTHGFLSVARNPVTVGYACRNGAPKAISHAIEIGKRYLDGGVSSVLAYTKGKIIAEGNVSHVGCEPKGGLDVGQIELDDANKTVLHFVNEYILMERGRSLTAHFPDLIATISDDRPIASSELSLGMHVQVIRIDRSNLILSRTMSMADLYEPIYALINKRFATDRVQ